MSTVPFVHLHVHTEYSLLDGASRIKELVARAKALGMTSLAITDHGTMYGAVDFYKEAKKQGLKPIIGCEVYVAPRSRLERAAVDGESAYHLVLLAENETGYRNLVELVSRGHCEGFYYKPRIDHELLAQYKEGLIVLSACLAGEIPAALLRGHDERAEELAAFYLELLGPEHFFLELQDHGMPEQRELNPRLAALAGKLGISLVATNDLHYVEKKDSQCHDVLLCIQMGKTVDEEGRMRFPSDEFYLKSGAEMDCLFAAYPEALANTCRIAERCQVDFEFGQFHLPEFPLPPQVTADAYLRDLCAERLPHRYPQAAQAVQARLDYELEVIRKMGYSSYFLIVWDFINHARQQRIAVGPGRGSAAGSIVAYLLGITNIDPLRYGLLFERFLNPERVTMPDIDIDFCYVRRGEVIEYVAQRYGSDRVAQIITFGTMAAKAAIRDVGRALNLPYGEVDRIAKLVPGELGITLQRALETSPPLREAYEGEEAVRQLLDLAMAVEGLPRHASTHAAGLVIAKEPLTHLVPLQRSAEGFLTTQYDKDRVEEIGLLKMDLLGLRTLTVIGDTLELVRKNRGLEVDLESIPLDDAQTCVMLGAGDTAGVFQVESSGMTNLVKELKPERFDDLIPLVALYRPGPLGSGMVTDFVNGRHGRKNVTYMHPLLEPILADTFGVILYQEQVMQIASTLAGFSLGQADLLRRAMGKKKHAVLEAQKESFLLGAAQKGIEAALAREVFELMAHFADYGFNKSHSAAYALVTYQTAYLKAHFPQEFMAATLTSIMGASDKVGHYIEECRRMGIAVLPPDVNASDSRFSVDQEAIRFGLSAVKNVGEGAIESVMAARAADGPFESLVDFCTRVDMRLVNKRVLESLIKCGAFDSTGARRSQLLAVLDRAVEVAAGCQRDAQSGQLGLFGEEELAETCALELPELPELPLPQLIALEKEMTGFYITGHPLEPFRPQLEALCSVEQVLAQPEDGKKVRLGGMVAAAKRISTRSGDMMCFVALEDFTRQMEVVVFPRVFHRAMALLVPDTPIVVSGKISASEEGVKVLAERIAPLRERPAEVRLRIRKEQEEESIFASLRTVLARHKGSCRVLLHLVDSRRVIATEERFWIEPTAEALAELEQVLGAGSVNTA